MKQLFTIIIIGLIIVALIILSFQLNTEQRNAFDICATLISALASIITLVIALLLYDKYGLRQGITKTQTDIVLEQLEIIKTARFIIKTNDSFLQFFPAKSRTSSYELFYAEKLVFSASYWEYTNHIFRLSSSIYMPKEIVERINLLKPSSITHIKMEEINSYAMVIVNGGAIKDSEFGKISDGEMSFQRFYSLWIDVIEIMVKWLNDKIEVNQLNIDF
jgi:hypothetical protein